MSTADIAAQPGRRDVEEVLRKAGLTRFHRKAVIVTGATSGIGRAAAEGFVREGASVVVVGRDEAALRDVVDSAPGASGRRDLHLLKG